MALDGHFVRMRPCQASSHERAYAVEEAEGFGCHHWPTSSQRPLYQAPLPNTDLIGSEGSELLQRNIMLSESSCLQNKTTFSDSSNALCSRQVIRFRPHHAVTERASSADATFSCQITTSSPSSYKTCHEVHLCLHSITHACCVRVSEDHFFS